MIWPSVLLLALTGSAVQGEGLPAEVRAVSFRDGTLSASELESWLRYRPPSARLAPDEARRRRVEERVLAEVLDRRFVALGLVNDPEAQGWQRLLERRVAAAALQREVNDEAVATEAAVEAAFLADPHRFDRAQRWQLQNLFKRYPVGVDDAQREQLRREMAALRERLVAGADFAELARSESDSATRERGGWLGSTTLVALQPAIADAVAALAPGDLSPVIETADGLTLLRCAAVLPAVQSTPDEVRRRFADALREDRFAQAWDALSARLLAELAPDYRLQPLPCSLDAAVVAVRGGPSGEAVSRRDLELYLRDTLATSPSSLAPQELRRQAEELVLLVGRAREAARRGLTSSEAYRERLRFETLELRAELALQPAIRARLQQPGEAEVTALYQRRRSQLIEPARLHLRTLEIPIRPELPAALYRTVHELGAQLEAGQLSLEQARDALAPHARLDDRGWLTELQAWQLGRTVEAALANLAPGEVSAPVQEGRALLILHVVARSHERSLTLEEARPQLERALATAQRERIRAELRAALLAEQEVRVLP